jgi:hypothetical protein
MQGAAWNVRKACEGGLTMSAFYYLMWAGIFGNGEKAGGERGRV